MGVFAKSLAAPVTGPVTELRGEQGVKGARSTPKPTDPEAGLTAAQKAAISRGDAPPIPEFARRRKGAVLTAGNSGDTLG